MGTGTPRWRARWVAWCLPELALALALGVFAASTAGVRAQSTEGVVDLMFLLDGSGSISDSEWQLQLDGYAAALQDPAAFPTDGSIAVGVLQWSATTRIEVPLTVLDGEAAVDRLVEQFSAIQQIGSSTNPGDGVRAGTDHLLDAGADPALAEWTLCMSTDGTLNSGEDLSTATDYALSSGVDRYSVIGIELSDSSLREEYGPHVFGGGVVVRAENSAEFASLIIGGCVNDAVSLRAIEVNQSVQDWENSVSLVAGKDTVVRVFLETLPGEAAQRVSGRLFGRSASGAPLPGSPLTAINPAATTLVEENVASRRQDYDVSLNFVLPESWRSGDVVLEFEGAGTALACDEPPTAAGQAGGDCKVEVSFTPETDPRLHLIGIRYEDASGAVVAPTVLQIAEQYFRTRSMFPFAEGSFRFDALTGTFDEAPHPADVNTSLFVKRVLDEMFGGASGPAAHVRYMGVLNGNGSAGSSTIGKSKGIPGPVFSGYTMGLPDRPDTGRLRHVLPHEAGHAYGLRHTVSSSVDAKGRKVGYCNAKAGSSTPAWPYVFTTGGGNTRPVLGPLDQGIDAEIWGLDTRFAYSDTNGLAVIDPRTTWEVMSYCDDGGGPQGQWIGVDNWDALRAEGFTTSVAALSTSGSRTDSLLIRGRIDFEEPETAVIDPVLGLRTELPSEPPSGEYRVSLRDAAGAELVGRDFTPELQVSRELQGNTGVTSGLFAIPVPRPAEAVGRIAVLHSGVEIGTHVASAAPPSVEITAPADGSAVSADPVQLAWNGSDPDGDPLAYTVQYSSDGGASWNVLAVDLRESALQVGLRDLSASSAARLRVIASDGVHSASDTTGDFSVANSAPFVAVESPPDDSVFFSGVQSIVMSALAHDTEDGDLSASIEWSSDLDGFLGTGAELVRRADTLSEGTHVLTAAARDGEGAAGSDSVRIEVFRVAPPPGGDVGAVCTDLVAGRDQAVGEVCVEQFGSELAVTYLVPGDWKLTETQLAVADALEEIPARRGHPHPGRFAHKGVHDPGVDTFTYLVDVGALGSSDDELVIAAHADVERAVGGSVEEEGAWGAGEQFDPDAGWAMHFTHVLE